MNSGGGGGGGSPEAAEPKPLGGREVKKRKIGGKGTERGEENAEEQKPDLEPTEQTQRQRQ